MWQREYSIETTASPETVWKLFHDVPGWKTWNQGIERISMEGPFAEGTEFLMQPPGQEAFTSRLVAVRENELFEDETVLGDIRVVVAHRIQPTGSGRCRVTYAATVHGPDAEEVGMAVTEDFPDVLKSLARLAEGAPLKAAGR
jgi:uncharacterized protein YndB with AHSA1/START domain